LTSFALLSIGGHAAQFRIPEAKDFMNEEVSSRATATLCHELDRHRIPLARVIAGMSLTESQLRGTKTRLSWNDFVEFLERITAALGGLEAWQHADPNVHKTPGNEVAMAITRTLAKPAFLYWAIAKWMGPSLFRHVRFNFERTGPNRGRLTIVIPDNYAGSIPYFHTWLHGITYAPGVIGLPKSVVNFQISSHRAEFDIHYSPTISMTQRLRAFFAMFASGKTMISELANREREIRDHYERLAEIQGTLLEREKQLRLSQEQASMAKLAAVGEMAGGIAHEINNPLSIVMIQAQQSKRMILESADKNLDGGAGEILKKIDGIIRHVSRAAETVQALRLISRDTGSDPVAKIQARELIQEALQICASRFQSLGIEVQVVGLDQTIEIEGRATQLIQALLSCFNNSCDAVAELPVRWLRIECAERRDPLPSLEITINDSGTGISPKNAEKVFQPFFTTKKVGMGAGLGLSTARGIVEGHGGRIAFDLSAPHTKLTIRIPKSAPGPTPALSPL